MLLWSITDDQDEVSGLDNNDSWEMHDLDTHSQIIDNMHQLFWWIQEEQALAYKEIMRPTTCHKH